MAKADEKDAKEMPLVRRATALPVQNRAKCTKWQEWFQNFIGAFFLIKISSDPNNT